MDLLNFSWRKKLPSILQAEQTECGLACLAMILNFYGYKIDLTSLRAKHPVSLHGLTLKYLIHTSDSVNLSSRPLRLEIDELLKLQTPAILHWDMNHYVVLKEVKNKHIIIHNPAIGVQKITRKALGKHFTGVALELSPTQEFEQTDEEKKLKIRDLWTRAVGIKRSLLQLFLLSLLFQIFSLSMPFYAQLFIDDVMVSRDVDLLNILALGFLIIIMMKVFTELIRSFVVLHFSNKLSFQFATNMSRHLLKLPIDYFNKRHIGDLVSRFGSLNNIKDFISSGVVEIFIDGLMVIGTLALMCIYSLTLTLVALIAVVIYAFTRIVSYRILRTQNEELIIAGASENTTFMENIRAIQGIKLFGKESDRNSVWQNAYADVINSGIKVQKINITIQFCNGLLIGIEHIVLILLAGYAVLNGELSVGMVIAYISYKDQFFNRIFSLLDKILEFKLLEVHLARLADIAFEKAERNTVGFSASSPIHNSHKFLQLSNISFRYSPDSPLLFKNVNLKIRNNESVAIIGSTGCGKSTLLKIILSLYQPENGSVLMHEVPITQMGLGPYRREVAGVLQDDNLLSGSIFDNITFFDQNPDRERVEYAANMAAIAKEIQLMPMQYDTLVGNMGTALSGGQIQRILLARAFYKEAKLIVLDEATSNLDIATERAVNQSIRQLDIARIFVAHRPQTIKYADTIYELTCEGLTLIQTSEINKRGI
ncbi:peptidase domain-containing ABC transporter [Gammaproteobacteria bacterium AH-315-E17]|nr:peptidase domain-containing ABC transporter [Gammaproteobacteria bacterium AH-315-E17]